MLCKSEQQCNRDALQEVHRAVGVSAVEAAICLAVGVAGLGELRGLLAVGLDRHHSGARGCWIFLVLVVRAKSESEAGVAQRGHPETGTGETETEGAERPVTGQPPTPQGDRADE